ncbi:RHS repeat-associated core domain-containing protein [Pseudomonas sp. 5FOS]|uniref:RHS repeat-associated core domain-containing protein n=1 Tax=unclassified Pseudomonas TaxID=196821 RepID=UPI001F26BC79|nr:RHS repeat-associated core domain-containing protein [Pseudomonas sp. KCA11]MCE5994360.1 RHS repeat-associated core domain-containing protein [Pseudomonas sp. KCA11]
MPRENEDLHSTSFCEALQLETAALAYSPYGFNGRQASGVSTIGFNGELLEKHSGTYPLGNGYRPYSPAIMRFLAPDSWSPLGKGGLNAYCYCAADPVNNVDPDGHVTVTPPRRPVITRMPNGSLPPRQTAQHLNRALNSQRLQIENNPHNNPLTPTPHNQQPRVNRNPLANGGRMPFEDRRNPSVALREVVTLANDLLESRLNLARTPDILARLNDPQMREDYLADISRIRNEVTPQQDRLNTAMVRWFHS